jgi:hypothetical protein
MTLRGDADTTSSHLSASQPAIGYAYVDAKLVGDRSDVADNVSEFASVVSEFAEVLSEFAEVLSELAEIVSEFA